MSKISVLFLLSSFQTGGAETQYGNLIRNIDRNRFTPILGLVLYKNNVPSDQYLERFGGAEQKHFIRKSKFDFSVIFSVATYAKRNNIGLIQSQLFMDNQIARFAGLLSGIKVITSVRGEIGPLIGPRKMWFERKAQILSERIIVNSEWLGDYLSNQGVDRSKIVVIYNGVEYSRLICKHAKEDLREKYRIPKGDHVVSIVARLHPMKDHITFLESISLIKESLPNLTVLIVGDGEERKSLEAYGSALKLHDTVRFMGNLEDGINEIYRIIDLLMLTSKWGESFPNVILEAMASNVPVVASNISAVNEIIDDNKNGFIVESGDVEGFAQKAIEVLREKNLSERLKKAGRHKVELFNIPVMVKKYEDLYEEIHTNKQS